VAEAVRDYASAATATDQELSLPLSFPSDTRAAAARLLGATPAEIAFVGPTSLGLSTVAAGLDMPRGTNVLVYHDDYPSNVYPWMALADRGIEVRFLNIRELGRITPRDVIGQVDEATQLVALASCHFLSGHRLDVDTIGKALRERGILFCVDGIQTLGAFATPVGYVDFLAADAHKWLLGPTGAGILYVRREVQDRLRPVMLGWHNVKCPGFVAQETMELRRDARRYEPGSHTMLALVGLRTALDLALELGVPAIGAELERKRRWLVDALVHLDYTVLNPRPGPGESGGITSFWKEGVDAADLHARLTAGGVTSSLRTDRSGRRYIRFSPHYYNTDAELQRAISLL
jgi:selenocysteine lyase/cysteine desulfurase